MDRRHGFPTALACVLASILCLAGCGLFDPRTPEPPLVESGTFLQPDTPDQVIANVQAAIAELNPRNYSRSFADDFSFVPADPAQNQSIWAGWGRSEEERYATQLFTSAQLTTGNELIFVGEPTSTFEQEDRFRFEASYALTVHHRSQSPELPATVQGRLLWVIQQGPDGLWRLQQWTDQAVGGSKSWSDLKAEFSR